MIIYLKSKEEIEGFKIAGRITGEILNIVLSKVEPGISTEQLNQIALSECKKRNVKPAFLGQYDFPAAICASVNKCLVHGLPNLRPLQEGDFVSIDLGINYNGFIGDSAETVVVGKEPSDIIINCRESLNNAIKKALPTNTLNDISKEIFSSAKYSIPFGYGGHGVGVNELHSDPYVSNVEEENDVSLYPGMVFAIEPMLIDGSEITTVSKDGFSVMANGQTAHCEHTIAITEEEPIILTERSLNE